MEDAAEPVNVEDGTDAAEAGADADENPVLTADAFGLLEKDSLMDGRDFTFPYPCLRATMNGENGTEEYYLTTKGKPGSPQSFYDFIDPAYRADGAGVTPDESYNDVPSPVQEEYTETVEEWGPGIADVLNGVLDASDFSVEAAEIGHVSGNPANPDSFDAYTNVRTTEGEEIPTELWTGVILAMLEDAPIRADASLWTTEESLRQQLGELVVDFTHFPFQSLDQSMYQSTPADTGPCTEGRYLKHIHGTIRPSNGKTRVSGLPYDITGVRERTQMVLEDEIRGTIPVSKTALSQYARRDYKERVGQTPANVDPEYRDTVTELVWHDFARIYLDEDDWGIAVGLEQIGDTPVNDPDEEFASYDVYRPTELYTVIDGTAYRSPQSDFQSLVPAVTEEFEILQHGAESQVLRGFW